MTDFATLGGTHTPGLTGGEGREVVVVHVALGGDGRKVVQLLLHAQHVQGGHAEDLGFATLEQGRAVYARKYLNLGSQGTDVLGATTIHTDALG